MKTPKAILFLLACASVGLTQTHTIYLCDQEASPKCAEIQAAATLSASTQALQFDGANANFLNSGVTASGFITGLDVIGTNSNFGAVSTTSGGMSAGLGYASGQGFYPVKATTCASLSNVPTSFYGGMGFAAGTTYCFWDATTSAWLSEDISLIGSCSGCLTTSGGQTISASDTFAAGLLAEGDILVNGTVNLGASSGYFDHGYIDNVNLQASNYNAGFTSVAYETAISNSSPFYPLVMHDNLSNNIVSFTGGITPTVNVYNTLQLSDLGSAPCLGTNSSGYVVSVSCGSGTVTSIATTGPISGGTITGSGTISCPTCLTTSGGQTITGRDTFNVGAVISQVSIGTTVANVPLEFGPNTYTAPLGSSYAQYQMLLYDGGSPPDSYGLGVDVAGYIGLNSVYGYKFYAQGGSTPLMEIGGVGSSMVTIPGGLTVGAAILPSGGAINLASSSGSFNEGYINDVQLQASNYNAGFTSVAYETAISNSSPFYPLVMHDNLSNNIISFTGGITPTVNVYNTLQLSDLGSAPCLGTNSSGYVVSVSCGSGTVTSIATTGPISGGTITGSGTISCPTCLTSAVTSIATSGPISGGTITSAGTISCSTCLTTTGSQTISASDTFSGGLTVGGAILPSGGGINLASAFGGFNDGYINTLITQNEQIQCCSPTTTYQLAGNGGDYKLYLSAASVNIVKWVGGSIPTEEVIGSFAVDAGSTFTGPINAIGGLTSTSNGVGSTGFATYSGAWNYGLASHTMTVNNPSGTCTIIINGGIITGGTC